MRVALQQAEQAAVADEVPVGAVVVLDNHIIARAHNQVESLCDATAHAELLALTAAFAHCGAKYLPTATLYVTLEPCCMCAGALYWAQIGRLVYGAADPKRGHTQHQPPLLHPKTTCTTGVQQEAATALLQRFFQARRPPKST